MSEKSKDEIHVEGWEEIAKYFPMVTAQTVRKKYGKEMLDYGWAFKTRRGKYKNPRIWSFPSLIQKFVTKKQIDQGYV